MCTCITFCWTRQLASPTLTGPVIFGVHELQEISPPNVMEPIKVVLNNCLVQDNLRQVHITPVLQMQRDQS
jgi:hypothetical protein